MGIKKRAPFKKRGFWRGFTLIELLIVIAIILILVAIALPNFLEAQIRARVTKSKGEIRTLAIALESYRLDFGIYPGRSTPSYRQPTGRFGLLSLLSPVQYLKELPDDPFPIGFDFHTVNRIEIPGPFTYWMTGVDNAPNENLLHPHGGRLLRAYVVFSAGPDTPEIEVNPEDGCMAFNRDTPSYYTYSPTNGTKSGGDIWLFGGENAWMGVDAVRGGGCQGPKSRINSPASGVVYDDVRLFRQFPPGQTL